MITPAEIDPVEQGLANLRARVRTAAESPQPAAPRPSHYWVCVDPENVIQAILIPRRLSATHTKIAMAHGGKWLAGYPALAERWKLAYVLARVPWGHFHEELLDGPLPHGQRLEFV